jgi:hypothetical protein
VRTSTVQASSCRSFPWAPVGDATPLADPGFDSPGAFDDAPSAEGECRHIMICHCLYFPPNQRLNVSGQTSYAADLTVLPVVPANR